MSSINNIPFDINRTAVDKNKPVEKTGSRPVTRTEAAHSATEKVRTVERRQQRYERRQNPSKVLQDRRMLKQRRQTTDSRGAKDEPKKNTSGSIIDIQV